VRPGVNQGLLPPRLRNAVRSGPELVAGGSPTSGASTSVSPEALRHVSTRVRLRNAVFRSPPLSSTRVARERHGSRLVRPTRSSIALRRRELGDARVQQVPRKSRKDLPAPGFGISTGEPTEIGEVRRRERPDARSGSTTLPRRPGGIAVDPGSSSVTANRTPCRPHPHPNTFLAARSGPPDQRTPRFRRRLFLISDNFSNLRQP
jgi:hypothetical protein